MITGFVYQIQNPKSMNKQFTTDTKYAQEESQKGMIVFGRRYKTIGDDQMKCSICGEPIFGYGNNAEPINDGLCCDVCNIEKVIPARLKEFGSDQMESPKQIKTDEEDNRPWWVKESQRGWHNLIKDCHKAYNKTEKALDGKTITFRYFDIVQIIIVISVMAIVIFGTWKLLEFINSFQED